MELHRPYIRKATRQAVEANTPRNEKGQFLDLNTGKYIEGPYDLGHRPGHEFRLEKQRAMLKGLPQVVFNDLMNDPALYLVEDPSSNRSHIFEAKNIQSCAQRAYRTQGLENAPYLGHDRLANGVIPRNSDQTIYVVNWGPDAHCSGYFTDEATVSKCVTDKTLNANQLGEALQLEPNNRGTGGVGPNQHRPCCTAYEIDWDRLEELEEEDPELYQQLTDPDGMGEDDGGIKCAYGQAQANTQFGEGGGNQYYIDEETFNKARDAGVFVENPEKSYSESEGNLVRTDIPNTEEYQNELATEKEDVVAKEEAKGTPTPEELNGYVPPENEKQPYIAQPDPAYERLRDTQQNKTGSTDDNENAAVTRKIPNENQNVVNQKDQKTDDIPNENQNSVNPGTVNNATIPNNSQAGSEQGSQPTGTVPNSGTSDSKGTAGGTETMPNAGTSGSGNTGNSGSNSGSSSTGSDTKDTGSDNHNRGL